MKKASVCLAVLFSVIFSISGSLYASQQYHFVPGMSHITFDGKSTLHDFEGSTRQIKGELETDFGTFKDTNKVSVSISSHSLKTQNKSRDKNMYKKLKVENYPFIRFEMTSIDSFTPTKEKNEFLLHTEGKLTIVGVIREIKLDVTARKEEDGSIRIQGSKKLKMKDFGIKPPSIMFFVKVKNEIVVHLDVIAVENDN